MPSASAADYRQRKQTLLDAIRAQGASMRSVGRTLARLTRLTDNALRALWRDTGFDAGFALLAVGGYGRGELFPYSDIDILLLLPSDADPTVDAALRERIENFISRCWDAGLEIGSSVRTIRQCLDAAQADVTVRTALLESRLVTGSRALLRQFQRRFADELDALDFFTAKWLEMRQRHAKYEDTPYALEPNCKESPGGLRDLHIILWTARAAGINGRWNGLAAAGLVTPRELRELRHNEAVISAIRARLHVVAGRREDRLVFDLQNTVAESFGYTHRYAADGRILLRAGEALMRRYYWAAKAVTQLNQVLLQGIEETLRAARGEQAPAPRRVNERFLDNNGLLEVARDDLYQRQPHAILETFLLFEQAPGITGLAARTLRALYNARPLMDQAFRNDPVNRETFMAILRQPSGITHAFRLMNQTSVLGRYLWVFRRIVGQMQHDLFHVYTVDQHILMVLRNMRRFFVAEHAHEYPFCSQLVAGWDKPWILFTAALFHDIAKGRGGNHSELGAAEARRFCMRHAIDRQDARLIEFLVRQHLTMSTVAQKQDLSDPGVIQNFAQRVGNERNLTALYLLTVADVRGTSPKVWNAWKAKLLEDLYRLTVRALGGRAPDAGAVIESRKRQAITQLGPSDVSREARQALWDTLQVSYFMRHDAGDIAWHTRHLARHPQTDAGSRPSAEIMPPIVRARLSPVGEGLQVLVYARDQPDLFARICGHFDRAGFSILDAKIHTTRDGRALDTFQIVRSFEAEDYQELIAVIEAGLPAAIQSQAELPALRMGRVSRRVKSFPIAPRVDLRPDERAQHWLLSLSASDRVGRRYGIARVLVGYQIDVELAKITTLGERVEDVFLLQGARLQDSRTQLEMEQALMQALQTQ
jgi:[protein-PII] uridylyltransferase